ncbi:MAG: hypothetical protein EOO10_13325 [Chitinophagaceae bacterium]|nr:MAG: hypothetical protein EOO10_13325 [Chitinophagaceae bacterium]
MTFEEQQELIFLEIIYQNAELTKAGHRLREQKLNDVFGDGYGAIGARLEKGGCLTDFYVITQAGISRIDYLKQKRRADRIQNLLLWIAALTGIISVILAALQFVIKDEPSNKLSKKEVLGKEQISSPPPQKQRPDTIRVQRKAL